MYLLDAVDLGDELLDLLGHLRTDRTAWARERIGDADGSAIDLDVVDQPELDEVESELRIYDVAQRDGDSLECGHQSKCRRRPAATPGAGKTDARPFGLGARRRTPENRVLPCEGGHG